MTVSCEGFLLCNAAFDSWILLLSGRLTGHRGGKRCLLSGSLGAGFALCSYFPRGAFLRGFPFRLAVCGLMVAITYIGSPLPGWKKYLRHLGTTFICTWLLGGMGCGLLFTLGQTGWGLLPALCTALAGGGAMLLLTVQSNRAKAKRTAKVTLRVRGRTVRFMAYIDTGNVLREPLSNLPVLVAEKRALSGLVLPERMRRVPYVTVSGSGCLYAFAPEKMWVEGRAVEAMVAPFDGALKMEGEGLLPGELWTA